MTTNENTEISRDMMEFVVYIINETADRLGTYPSRIYHALEQSGCIRDYMFPYYDVLHTMGTEAIIDDVVSYAAKRGVIIC